MGDNNTQVDLINNKEDNSLVENSHHLDRLSNIFYEFYSRLLQDHHAHEFFQSIYTIKELIEKQSKLLYKLLRDIQEKKDIDNIIKILHYVARRHFNLGINERVIFNSIDFYVNLLREHKEELGLEEYTILELEELLKQSTADEYIKGILKSTFDFFSVGKNIKLYSRYDKFFEEAINKKLESILKCFENDFYYYTYSKDSNSCNINENEFIDSHIECMVGRLLHGIGFDIMTFGNENIKVETIATHKLVHSYMRQLIKYYTSKEYSKAVSLSQIMVSSLYKMIYDYQTVSKYWNENKRELLPAVLNTKKYKNKLFLITLAPDKDIVKHYELIINRLKDVLVKNVVSFDFLFFTRVDNLIYLFICKSFACERYKAFLVHYSTDYVFDGKKEALYIEEDRPNPLSEYAKSKYLGEVFVKEETERYLIFRVSWVYGEGKQNFLYKLTEWAKAQEHLRVACDEFSVPTSTRTIVEVTLKAIKDGLTGLYHLVNSGYTSRFEWAREFFRLKGINKFIYPAYQSDFNLPAKRPRFSAMSNEKICRALGIEIKDWKEEMEKVLGYGE